MEPKNRQSNHNGRSYFENGSFSLAHGLKTLTLLAVHLVQNEISICCFSNVQSQNVLDEYCDIFSLLLDVPVTLDRYKGTVFRIYDVTIYAVVRLNHSML